MNLIPAFLLEGCLSTIIKSAVLSGRQSIDTPIGLNTIYKLLTLYACLFRNENLFTQKFTYESLRYHTAFFVKKGIIEVSDDRSEAKLVHEDHSISFIEFFHKLILPLFDTYLITLITIEQLCGKNLVIKQKTLVKQLHIGFKSLYSQGNIPMLHSCLKETINTAIERFEQMKLLETTTYKNKKGNMTVFLRSPAESSKSITEIVEQM